MNIIDFIKDKNKVHFMYFRQNFFYYSVHKPGSREYYSFPIPLEEVGIATLESEDTAITFMRWIRKAIEDKTFNLIP